MEILTVERLSAYLPYELEVISKDDNDVEKTFVLIGIVSGMASIIDDETSYDRDLTEIKPILRPLGDLTKEIMERIYANVNAPEHMPDYCDCETLDFNGKEFTHTFEGDVSYDGGYEFERTTQICSNQYALLTELFKMHFDYFGLISKGLAIDINTLK